MPEYLAPGVYVEETSFRSKSIEGVGTSTTAFVGPTLRGPVDGTPELLTSLADYERIYGGLDDLAFSGASAHVNRNYVAHAVRAYFNNGGSRLYVARVFAGANVQSTVDAATAKATTNIVDDGASPTPKVAQFRARFPGARFNALSVTVSLALSPTGRAGLERAADGSVARFKPATAPGGGATGIQLWVKSGGNWLMHDDKGAKIPTSDAADAPQKAADLGKVGLASTDTGYDASYDGSYAFMSATVFVSDGADVIAQYDDVALGPGHPRYLGTVLAMDPTRRAEAVANPLGLFVDTGFTADPAAVAVGLFGTSGAFADPAEGRTLAKTFSFGGGGEGALPGSSDYERALRIVQGLEDVSIVAAPGYSARDDKTAQAIQDVLITHAEQRRAYRIAVLDAPADKTPSEMRELRGKVDSTRAALYYPWVVVDNPLAGPGSTAPGEIRLPPSGFMAGIYARNDVTRGVWKAPANEVVLGALRFERDVNFAEQELLNPIGVNCLRYLSGRGYRVWGARTVSSDPEWKYVNVRRYFNYLEASIDRGTQWAVFEPNGEMLWTNIRATVSDFLFTEWKSGALLGTKPEEAFFVRCDRTTMTQNDLDNGRLICLIGVAVVKPAEFVIFRIGQKTADAK